MTLSLPMIPILFSHHAVVRRAPITFLQITPKPTRSILASNINPHYLAADGNLDLLKELAAKDRSLLFLKDENGWRPLHEAARGGHSEVIKYLLKEGAQVNERTNSGGTPLYWAERNPAQNLKTIALLKQHGGVSLPPKPVVKTEPGGSNKRAEESNDKK
jgi:hypothetical protein